MERRAVNGELDAFSHKHPREQKRKRSSSATSYLEPAVFKDTTNDKNQRHCGYDACYSDAEVLKSIKLITESPSGLLETSARPNHPLVKTAKTYEKRSRHRTKEDRYELKHDRKGRPNAKQTETNRGKRSKRKERSGAALSHSFTAKNVEPDRLTVRITVIIED